MARGNVMWGRKQTKKDSKLAPDEMKKKVSLSFAGWKKINFESDKA